MKAKIKATSVIVIVVLGEKVHLNPVSILCYCLFNVVHKITVKPTVLIAIIIPDKNIHHCYCKLVWSVPLLTYLITNNILYII